MKSVTLIRIALGAYLLIFFSYLLGPLLVMSLTAFNSASFPSVSPWACFSYEWFDVLLRDKHIRDGIYYSIIIGLGTVLLSVSMGLAASIVLTQVWPRLRSTYYTMIIAPILIPGVVLGISTLVFWDRASVFLGVGNDTFIYGLFHNGLFLTILGQSTFIASYAMLVFVARLQRFDPGLTEAALDLGATHTQAFRKIMLPFMRPAIASASVLAFLASFENYNTTTFTIIDYKTLTTVLAQKVRLGINPSISSLAFIIIVITIFAALIFEATQHNRKRKDAVAQGKAVPAKKGMLPPFMQGNIAAFGVVILSCVVIVMVGTAGKHDPQMCKMEVREARQLETQKRIKALQDARAAKREQSTPAEVTPTQPSQAPSGAFGNVFAPTNLTTDTEEPVAEEPKAGSGAFGNVFAPTNLNADE
jgi:spermidine/putrescine transport system permease protein